MSCILLFIISLISAQNITDTLLVNGSSVSLEPGPNAAHFWRDAQWSGQICYCQSWKECSVGCYDGLTVWQRMTKTWILVVPYKPKMTR